MVYLYDYVQYMEEVLIVLETESTVDITMSRMITQLFHRIGMNLLFHHALNHMYFR